MPCDPAAFFVALDRGVNTIVTLTMNPALDVTTSAETVRPGHKLRCAQPRFDPGGGGINVARTIVRLGGDALAIFPSGGAPGERVRELLSVEKVPFKSVAIAETTRESLTVVDRTSNDQYRFVLPGPALSPSEQAHCLETLAAIQPRPAWLVMSGSLPPGIDHNFFLQIGRWCRSHGVELAVDTSGKTLATCDGIGAALVKPSLRELEQIVGRTVTEAEEPGAARQLIDRGFARIVVLSLGERGALLVSARGSQRFAAPKVESKTGVGAGDAMLGAIVLGLDRGMALSAAVRRGVAAGAAATMAQGTGLPRIDDVERLYATMQQTGPNKGPGAAGHRASRSS